MQDIGWFIHMLCNDETPVFIYLIIVIPPVGISLSEELDEQNEKVILCSSLDYIFFTTMFLLQGLILKCT